MNTWYEVRVDGEKVAAFAPIRREAAKQAFRLVENTRGDLYRGKVMEIVAVHPWYEEVIHKECPIVLKD